MSVDTRRNIINQHYLSLWNMVKIDVNKKSHTKENQMNSSSPVVTRQSSRWRPKVIAFNSSHQVHRIMIEKELLMIQWSFLLCVSTNTAQNLIPNSEWKNVFSMAAKTFCRCVHKSVNYTCFFPVYILNFIFWSDGLN